jgi:hypothetical protein
MQKYLDYLKSHLPVVVGVVLVALNYLIDTGTLTLSSHTVSLVNALLAATGLGVLHYRQQTK